MDLSCLFLNILMISVCYAPGNHHEDCHDKNRCINEAIADIGKAFDEHICHAFKDVDCSHHVLKHDEMICATNGITYRNHCEYASARCVQILDKHSYVHHTLVNPLGIVSHSACAAHTSRVTTTGSPIVNTNIATTTLPLVSATSAGPSSAPLTNVVNSTVNSATPSSAVNSSILITSSSAAPNSASNSTAYTVALTFTGTSTVASQPLSTTMSTQAVLGSVFCQYKTLINCGIGFTVVCGSDGNFYPNKCELLKIQCSNPSLREESDMNKCSLTP